MSIPGGPGIPGGVPILQRGRDIRPFRITITGRSDGRVFEIANIGCQGLSLLEMRTVLADLVESSKPVGVIPTVPPDEKPTNGQPPADPRHPGGQQQP